MSENKDQISQIQEEPHESVVNKHHKRSIKFNKNLVVIGLILLALPLTIALVLVQQEVRSRASGAQIAKVEVSPGSIMTDDSDTHFPVGISALAYDGAGEPIYSGVTYEWSMSSTNSVGTLTKTQGEVTEFKPYNYGCGQLTVIAKTGSQTISKSVSVSVGSANGMPECSSSGPTPSVPGPSVAPSPMPIVFEKEKITILNYTPSVYVLPGASVKLFTIKSDGATGYQIFGYPTTYGPGINYSVSSGGISSGATRDVYVQVNSNVPRGTYVGTPKINSMVNDVWGTPFYLPQDTVIVGVPTPSVAPSPIISKSPSPTPAMTLTVDSPNGGETLAAGSTYRITWKSSQNIDKVALGYSFGTGSLNWITNGEITNTGYYDWKVNIGNTTNNQVKIWMIGYDTGVGSVTDQSDNFFTVLNSPTVTKAPTPTLAPTTQKLTLTPTADAFVRSTTPNQNFGTNTNLKNDSNPNEISYMRFNLTPLAGKTIVSAKLRIKVSDTTSKTLNLRRAVNTNWSETGITYNNRPAFDYTITSFNATTLNQVKELGVTGPVNLRKGGNLTLGIVSTGDETGAFYSRESTSYNRPQLIVEYK